MGLGKKLRNLFCKHEWEKFMGLRNIGGGKFAQKYHCAKCGKIKEVVK